MTYIGPSSIFKYGEKCTFYAICEHMVYVFDDGSLQINAFWKPMQWWDDNFELVRILAPKELTELLDGIIGKRKFGERNICTTR